MLRKSFGWVVLSVLVLPFVFSSCTCQKDVPEPPKRRAKLDRRGDAWSVPTRRVRDLPERKDLARRSPIERERPTPLPTRERQVQQEPAEIPEDFPDDVPVFEGAEVYGVQNLAQNAKNVLFRTDGEIPEVFSFYKDSMGSEGWNVEQEYQQDAQSFLSFEKDGMITNMTVARDSATGKRVIAVMYYKQQPLSFDEF